ncbi:hypothetical protein, partial [uncultured Gammaproteobacteria bacterium]
MFSPFQIHEKATAVSTALIDAIPAPSYIDNINRPNTLIEETIVDAHTTGGEFTPNNDNSNKVGVNITDGGKTITTTRTDSRAGWGDSGTFSTESLSGDGYVSFKLTQNDKNYMVGLSRVEDASSADYRTIDYAIYSTQAEIQVYENNSRKLNGSTFYENGGTYKIRRVGNTITYLLNDVVFYTSTTTTTVPLYMDTAFKSVGSRIEEVTMLNAPLVNVPRTASYHIDYNNVNLINKPAGGGSTTAQATDGEVDAGTETEARLFTPKQIDTKAKSVLPTQATQAEMTAG